MPLEYPPGWAPTPSAEQLRSRYLSQIRIVASHVEGQLPYDATVAMPVGAVVEVVRELEERAQEIRRLQASVLRSGLPAGDGGHPALPRLTTEQIEGLGTLLRAYAPEKSAAPAPASPEPAWRSVAKLSCAVEWVRDHATHPGFAQVVVDLIGLERPGQARTFWVVGRRSGDRQPLFQRRFSTPDLAQHWARALERRETCPELTIAPPQHLSGTFEAVWPGTRVVVRRAPDSQEAIGTVLGPAIGFPDVYVVGFLDQAPGGWHASEMQVASPSPHPIMADEQHQ